MDFLSVKLSSYEVTGVVKGGVKEVNGKYGLLTGVGDLKESG